ncbi:histone-lysine N-methyltransferase ATX5-like [Carex rostrata]
MTGVRFGFTQSASKITQKRYFLNNARLTNADIAKIIEYHGEQIRCSVSDAREARYWAENKDCYFFRVSDEFVCDTTRKGNVEPLINHSI